MKKVLGMLLLTMVLGLGCVPSVNASMVFDVTFDATFDRSLSGPFVGSGVLSFDDDLADGTYLISDLTNFSFSFTIIGSSFTWADLTDSTPLLGLSIYQGGTNFYFNGPTSPTASLGGALQVENSGGFEVGFEPNDIDGFPPPPFNTWVFGISGLPDTLFGGTYGVYTPIPEPSSLALLGLGGVSIALSAYRRRCSV